MTSKIQVLLTLVVLSNADQVFRNKFEEFCLKNDMDCDHSRECCKPFITTEQRTSILTDSLRKLITQKHNYYRNIMACGELMNIKGEKLPKAAKMHELSWNSKLEKLSVISAEQCSSDSTNTCKFSQGFAVNSISQSGLFWEHNKNLSIEEEVEKVIRLWFNQFHKTSFFSLTEVFDRPIQRKYNAQILGELKRLEISIDKSKTNSVAQFLNMMFDDADKLGCSLYNCPDPKVNWYSLTCSYNKKRTTDTPISIVEALNFPGDGCKVKSPKYCCLCRNSSVINEGESGPCDKYESFLKPYFNLHCMYHQSNSV